MSFRRGSGGVADLSHNPVYPSFIQREMHNPSADPSADELSPHMVPNHSSQDVGSSMDDGEIIEYFVKAS
jgi:hypothetical protein